MRKKLLVDMDGVLVDLAIYSMGRLGIAHEPWPYSRIEYNLPCFPESFWRGLGHHFWSTLPATEECDRIWELCCDVAGPENLTIVTAPNLVTREHYAHSVHGKLEWVKENLGLDSERVVFAINKGMLASRQTVLLDDCITQISNFRQRRGLAVLVPRPWNVLHGIGVLKHIEKQLRSIDWGPDD